MTSEAKTVPAPLEPPTPAAPPAPAMTSGGPPYLATPSVTPGGPSEAPQGQGKKQARWLKNLAIDANDKILGALSTYSGGGAEPPLKKSKKGKAEADPEPEPKPVKMPEVVILSDSDTDSDEEYREARRQEREREKKGHIEYLQRWLMQSLSNLIVNDGRPHARREEYILDLIEESHEYISDGSFHRNYVGKKGTEYLSGYVYAAEQGALDACQALCRAKRWEMAELLIFIKKNKKWWSKEGKVKNMNFAAKSKIKWK